jgi:methionyl-tRNA formyltransferase
MKKISKTIVFFGSGPVAAASLRKLYDDFRIEAVITKPKAEHHKGTVPVIELANELGLKIITVVSKKDLDEKIGSNNLQSEVAILIDFGIIVSQKVINHFKFGIINSHFSLLPEWRGADPITFAILSGQKFTGVSLMLLVKEMDEGPLLAQKKFNIPQDFDTPHLTQSLIDTSHELIVQHVPKYLSGQLIPYPQDITSHRVSHSRKLTASDGTLDFAKPANILEKEIRAYLGWPGSKTQIGSKQVTVTKAHVDDTVLPVGKMQIVNKRELLIGTSEKSLSVDELRPAGKNTMHIAAFIAGNSHLIRQ